jgi:hypothetical protein
VVRSVPLVGGAVGAGGGAIGAVRSKAKAVPLERLDRSCGDCRSLSGHAGSVVVA